MIAAEGACRGIRWEFVCNGAGHDVYRRGGKMIPIEPHKELGKSYPLLSVCPRPDSNWRHPL